MGMYDNLHYAGRVYQTKDLDCTLHTYYIENGRLLESHGHQEDKSPATAWRNQHPGEELPDNLKGFLGARGCITWIETGRKDLNYHGILNFYMRFDDLGWVEYDAKFTDGTLMELKPIPE